MSATEINQHQCKDAGVILTPFPWGREERGMLPKQGGAIIREKVGRNRKWRKKTNIHSQIPTQLMFLANDLGFGPIKLSEAA